MKSHDYLNEHEYKTHNMYSFRAKIIKNISNELLLSVLLGLIVFF